MADGDQVSVRPYQKDFSFGVGSRAPIPGTLKENLMLVRSELAPNIKSKSRVRHLPQWPFVELRIDGQSPTRPQETLAAITKKIFGFDYVFKVDSQ